MRVETVGSVWLFSEEEQRYARMPRSEGPRESPPGEDWGGPGAGALQDLVWHDYDTWRVERRPYQDVLVITLTAAGLRGRCVVAPVTLFDYDAAMADAYISERPAL